MELSEKVGARIRSIRQDKGLSQEELAYKSGLQQSQIYRIETGKRRFNSDHLDKISQALDVPIVRFFEEELEKSASADDQRLIDAISRLPEYKKEKIYELIRLVQESEEDIDVETVVEAVKLIRHIKGKGGPD